MSEEQEHAAIGKTVEEYGKIRKRLAALLSEADRKGNVLHSVARGLMSQNNSTGGVRFGDLPEELDFLPQPGEVQKLVQDILEALKRKQTLVDQLRQAGVDPKDD